MKQSYFFDTLRNYHTQLCVEFRNAHAAKDDAEIERIDAELAAVERLVEFYKSLPMFEGVK